MASSYHAKSPRCSIVNRQLSFVSCLLLLSSACCSFTMKRRGLMISCPHPCSITYRWAKPTYHRHKVHTLRSPCSHAPTWPSYRRMCVIVNKMRCLQGLTHAAGHGYVVGVSTAERTSSLVRPGYRLKPGSKNMGIVSPGTQLSSNVRVSNRVPSPTGPRLKEAVLSSACSSLSSFWLCLLPSGWYSGTEKYHASRSPSSSCAEGGRKGRGFHPPGTIPRSYHPAQRPRGVTI